MLGVSGSEIVKLTELEPQFLKRIDDSHFRHVDTLSEADGVEFLCPGCFTKNGGAIGTHGVLCWQPDIPQTTSPTPGRWPMSGRGYSDLTLTPSVQLTCDEGCCGWHGFITNGEVTSC